MKKIYFNHDGGVDDLVSLFLLLQMDNIELIGVSVIDADCYIEPATSASMKIINRFSQNQHIHIAKSNSRAKNPFPKEWRMHAFYIDALPILNESDNVQTTLSSQPAHEHLTQTLIASEEKAALLFTCPLTDLARALDLNPSIEEKIEKLYWMGGTFLKKGNVEEPGHNGSAEWNSFWDPEAVVRVFQSNIEIEMIVLESTNKVPLTIKIQKKWAKERNFVGLDFIGQCYATCSPLVYMETNSTYYLWDVLTTLAIGNPDLVKKNKVLATVYDKGSRQGQMEEIKNGRPIHIVYDVEKENFFSYLSQLSKKATHLEKTSISSHKPKNLQTL